MTAFYCFFFLKGEPLCAYPVLPTVTLLIDQQQQKITNSTSLSKTTLRKYLQPEREREIQSLKERSGPGKGCRNRGGSHMALSVSVALFRSPRSPEAAIKSLRTY